jgi:hypothetical protein
MRRARKEHNNPLDDFMSWFPERVPRRSLAIADRFLAMLRCPILRLLASRIKGLRRFAIVLRALLLLRVLGVSAVRPLLAGYDGGL